MRSCICSVIISALVLLSADLPICRTCMLRPARHISFALFTAQGNKPCSRTFGICGPFILVLKLACHHNGAFGIWWKMRYRNPMGVYTSFSLPSFDHLPPYCWSHKHWKHVGILDGSKQAVKARCWSDYKSQQLSIDAMWEAKNDDSFDPRRSDHVIGKDGRFVAKKGNSVPKNALTVTYLVHAYDVPYATFKCWKADSFTSKQFVPDHKGKSVLTDKTVDK